MNRLKNFSLGKPGYTPIPSIQLLIKSLFTEYDLDKVTSPWLNYADQYLWLSRSSLSLYLIAKLRFDLTRSKSINIFLPDFFCNEALSLVRTNDINLYFYNVNSNLEPIKESVYNLLEHSIPDIIIQVHYFGENFDCSFLRNTANKYHSWFVEDATHMIFPQGNVGKVGDFILYSPYKHFPIPNGALLVIPKSKLTDSINFKHLLKNLEDIQSSSSRSSQTQTLLKWIIKRIIQNIVQNRSVLSSNISIGNQHDNINPSYVSSCGTRVYKLSFRILFNLYPSFSQLVHRKRLISFKIYQALSKINNNYKDQSSNYITHMIPYSNNTTDFFQILKIQETIWSKFPTLFWPDLPPEVLANPSCHKVAISRTMNTLYLPIHISITDSQINAFLATVDRHRSKNSP